ncbi:MAG: LysM peptidoglycan-binding domain-containing protein [Betaproteobacteria bacterium]|nr:LysM peptidoglycan-binding domain-containing protein [Betaproteobacteria bacterium]
MPAPVEDRSASRAPVRPAAPQAAAQAAPPAAPAVVATPAVRAAAEPAKPLRGLDNAGKPGFYTVQRGDTLVRIALDNGQNWRDVARWNQIDNPNQIEVGEVLRVQPPPGELGAAPPRPLASAPPVGEPLPPLAKSPAQPPASAPAAAPASPSAPSGDELVWIWPAQGQTVGAFDEVKNKGVDIAGKAGDPVLAAADGRVVYAGAGLRGYGNLIILKHNNTYLTAYAHNRSLLVKEDQQVKQGQKIAEMGNTDAEQVKLHFEIRRQGKPVDPARYLPSR